MRGTFSPIATQHSCLQLAFELVQEAPIGIVGDDLVGEGLDHARFVQPHVRHILAALADTGVPLIHFGTGTTPLLELMAQAGGDVIGLDWRTPLAEGWRRVGGAARVGIQGNLDPAALLAPWEVVRAEAEDVLAQAAGRPGHIFNLGHGILPPTPVETLERLVAFVHEHAGAVDSNENTEKRQ